MAGKTLGSGKIAGWLCVMLEMVFSVVNQNQGIGDAHKGGIEDAQ